MLGSGNPVKLNGIPWSLNCFSNGYLTGFEITSWNSCGCLGGLGGRLTRAERDPVACDRGLGPGSRWP